MSEMQKYYKADFSIVENKKDEDYTVPFRFKYCCLENPQQLYIVSFDGTTYTNCKIEEDGSLTVFFDNQHMGYGYLVCDKSFYYPDESYADGNRKVEYRDTDYEIKLVKVVASIKGNYIKGEKKVVLVTRGGDAGIEGDKIKLNGLGVAFNGETVII